MAGWHCVCTCACQGSNETETTGKGGGTIGKRAEVSGEWRVEVISSSAKTEIPTFVWFRWFWDVSRQEGSSTRDRGTCCTSFLLVHPDTHPLELVLRWQTRYIPFYIFLFRAAADLLAGVWAPCGRGDSEVLERLQREAMLHETQKHTKTEAARTTSSQNTSKSGKHTHTHTLILIEVHNTC